MKYIETVLGQIEPEELGIADYHDHLVTVRGGEKKADRYLRLDRVDCVISTMKSWEALGGDMPADMNPIGCGRQVEMLKEIPAESGVRIIACMGFQRSIYYDTEHWVNRYPVEEMTRPTVEEVELDVETSNHDGPIVMRSTAKASVIKFVTHYNMIKPMEPKVTKVECMASLRTGVPISTHTGWGTMGLEAIELVKKFGVDPRWVTLGHAGRNPDLEYHKKMAARSMTLGYNKPSRTKYWPGYAPVKLTKRMCKAGYAGNTILGGDNDRANVWREYGGAYGYNHILENFVPRMKESGISEEDIHKMLVGDPARQFVIEK